ncbi:uncharacterized protein FPOAC1_013925 [Fusarium poae]|uniref:uncharacterized protein n=1 Tax=Fusarium poae TaxID=36050 RepID=UPI001D059B3F|nr:uncharacterized protein FPOAC1_013925 [Fusarium poae]KAG8664218.1 hypothetical protein FPOAC1_013925 [Fusarium poae]
MFQTKAILDHEVWQSHHDLVPPAKEEEVALHYGRAKLMCQHSGLSLHDIEALTEKFWDFHFDSTKPLDHAITTFHHVQLPPSALLGSTSKPKHERAEFLRQIWRVAVGTLSLSIMGISAMRVGTRIAALYSERRTILSPDGH